MRKILKLLILLCFTTLLSVPVYAASNVIGKPGEFKDAKHPDNAFNVYYDQRGSTLRFYRASNPQAGEILDGTFRVIDSTDDYAHMGWKAPGSTTEYDFYCIKHKGEGTSTLMGNIVLPAGARGKPFYIEGRFNNDPSGEPSVTGSIDFGGAIQGSDNWFYLAHKTSIRLKNATLYADCTSTGAEYDRHLYFSCGIENVKLRRYWNDTPPIMKTLDKADYWKNVTALCSLCMYAPNIVTHQKLLNNVNFGGYHSSLRPDVDTDGLDWVDGAFYNCKGLDFCYIEDNDDKKAYTIDRSDYATTTTWWSNYQGFSPDGISNRKTVTYSIKSNLKDILEDINKAYWPTSAFQHANLDPLENQPKLLNDLGVRAKWYSSVGDAKTNRDVVYQIPHTCGKHESEWNKYFNVIRPDTSSPLCGIRCYDFAHNYDRYTYVAYTFKEMTIKYYSSDDADTATVLKTETIDMSYFPYEPIQPSVAGLSAVGMLDGETGEELSMLTTYREPYEVFCLYESREYSINTNNRHGDSQLVTYKGADTVIYCDLPKPIAVPGYFWTGYYINTTTGAKVKKVLPSKEYFYIFEAEMYPIEYKVYYNVNGAETYQGQYKYNKMFHLYDNTNFDTPSKHIKNWTCQNTGDVYPTWAYASEIYTGNNPSYQDISGYSTHDESHPVIFKVVFTPNFEDWKTYSYVGYPKMEPDGSLNYEWCSHIDNPYYAPGINLFYVDYNKVSHYLTSATTVALKDEQFLHYVRLPKPMSITMHGVKTYNFDIPSDLCLMPTKVYALEDQYHMYDTDNTYEYANYDGKVFYFYSSKYSDKAYYGRYLHENRYPIKNVIMQETYKNSSNTYSTYNIAGSTLWKTGVYNENSLREYYTFTTRWEIGYIPYQVDIDGASFKVPVKGMTWKVEDIAYFPEIAYAYTDKATTAYTFIPDVTWDTHLVNSEHQHLATTGTGITKEPHYFQTRVYFTDIDPTKCAYNQYVRPDYIFPREYKTPQKIVIPKNIDHFWIVTVDAYSRIHAQSVAVYRPTYGDSKIATKFNETMTASITPIATKTITKWLADATGRNLVKSTWKHPMQAYSYVMDWRTSDAKLSDDPNWKNKPDAFDNYHIIRIRQNTRDTRIDRIYQRVVSPTRLRNLYITEDEHSANYNMGWKNMICYGQMDKPIQLELNNVETITFGKCKYKQNDCGIIFGDEKSMNSLRLDFYKAVDPIDTVSIEQDNIINESK